MIITGILLGLNAAFCHAMDVLYDIYDINGSIDRRVLLDDKDIISFDEKSLFDFVHSVLLDIVLDRPV